MDPKEQIPDEEWDYYSGLPNPMWYQENQKKKDGESNGGTD